MSRATCGNNVHPARPVGRTSRVRPANRVRVTTAAPASTKAVGVAAASRATTDRTQRPGLTAAAVAGTTCRARVSAAALAGKVRMAVARVANVVAGLAAVAAVAADAAARSVRVAVPAAARMRSGSVR